MALYKNKQLILLVNSVLNKNNNSVKLVLNQQLLYNVNTSSCLGMLLAESWVQLMINFIINIMIFCFYRT